MKLGLFLAAIILFAVPAFAQSGPLEVKLTWTATSAATTITTDATGTETAGPINGNVYRATVASGSTACPAFSTSSYTLLSTVSLTATAAAYVDSSVTTGSTVCYAVNSQFQAGGTTSAALTSFPVLAILNGTPGTPAALTTKVAPAGT